MALSKKTRFRILQRDMFTCKYCGRRPPEVVLEVDHVVSLKNGGAHNDENLCAACRDCNRGKAGDSMEVEATCGHVMPIDLISESGECAFCWCDSQPHLRAPKVVQ